MGVCSSSTAVRRRWFLTLSLGTGLAVVVAGMLLWQAVELSSLAAASERVDRARPVLSGVRLVLIGLLAVLWPWFPSLRFRGDTDDEIGRTRWMAFRWRVVGWLLIVELIIAQNLLGQFIGVIVHPT